MKNLFVILFIAFLLGIVSCSKEVISTDETQKAVQKFTPAKGLNQMNQVPYTHDFKMRNQYTKEWISLGSLYKKYGRQLRHSASEARSRKEWTVMTTAILQDVKSYDALTPKKNYTCDIQLVSLKLLRYYLLKQKSTKQNIEQIRFLVNILTKHGATDLDVLSEGVRYIKDDISNEEYQKHIQHIENEINRRQAIVEKYFVQDFEALQKAHGTEKAYKRYVVTNMGKTTLEIKHAREVLGLEGKPLDIKSY